MVRIRSSPADPFPTTENPRTSERSRAFSSAPVPLGAPETDRSICVLGAEGATAAASARGVGVLERESRTLHGRHVVDRHAVDVLRGERIDENLPATLIDDQVVVSGRVLDQESVLEPATTAGLNAHPKATAGGVDVLGIHELFYFNAGARGHRHHHVRLLNRAHLIPLNSLRDNRFGAATDSEI